VLGVRVYVQSNLSSKERMNTDVSLWNENIATALAEVNTRQSLLMGAGLVSGVDARALGASIMARRLVNIQPVQQEWREMLGKATHIGIAQISVQSTEAALRIVFAPTLEDSLLYYSRTSGGGMQDTYQKVRTTLLSSYKNVCCQRENLHHILRTNEWMNIHIAALAMKQAQMRFLNEQALSSLPVSTMPHLAYFSAEDEQIRPLAALLYQRDDLMP
jgi:hypothetical protein